MANYSGFETTGHTDVFYSRIWLVPEALDFTGLPVGSTLSFYIWNAYTSTKHLSTVFPSASIIGIAFSPASSFVFDPLEVLSYTAQIQATSPNLFIGTCLFDFNDSEDVTLNVQGQSFESFIYGNNWISNISEYYSYLTDIKTFNSGQEQRTRRRNTPRRGFSFKINPIASSDDSNRLSKKIENHLSYIFGAKTLVPIWQDVVRLGSSISIGATTLSSNFKGRDFQADKYCVIFDNNINYELAEIQSVSNTSIILKNGTSKAWPVGTKIIPIRTCIFSEDSILDNRQIANISDIDASFSILAEDLDIGSLRKTNFVPASMYKGKDVIILENNYIDGQTRQSNQNSRILDFEHTIFAPDRAWDRDKKIVSFNILIKDRDYFTNLLSIFNHVCGSWKSFWLVNKTCELEIASASAFNSPFITIKEVGITQYLVRNNIPVHLYAIDTSDNLYLREVVGAALNGSSTELLTLDQPFNVDVEAKTFKAFGILRLMRLMNDSLEVSWESDSIGTTSLSCIEVFDV